MVAGAAVIVSVGTIAIVTAGVAPRCGAAEPVDATAPGACSRPVISATLACPALEAGLLATDGVA